MHCRHTLNRRADWGSYPGDRERGAIDLPARREYSFGALENWTGGECVQFLPEMSPRDPKPHGTLQRPYTGSPSLAGPYLPPIVPAASRRGGKSGRAV